MSMALFFCQVLIETIIPPVMTERFGYTSYETSLIYMVYSEPPNSFEWPFVDAWCQIAGSISISVYFTIALTTRWTSDVFLLTFGWLMHCLGYIWLIYWLPQIQPGNNSFGPSLLRLLTSGWLGFRRRGQGPNVRRWGYPHVHRISDWHRGYHLTIDQMRFSSSSRWCLLDQFVTPCTYWMFWVDRRHSARIEACGNFCWTDPGANVGRGYFESILPTDGSSFRTAPIHGGNLSLD